MYRRRGKKENVGGQEVLHERELEMGEKNDELKMGRVDGITECTGGSSTVEE